LRASAAASAGEMQSALSDDGESRPPLAATDSAISATPGTLAISAPTSPITLRSASPAFTSACIFSGLR
jgi:hypothetical protein